MSKKNLHIKKYLNGKLPEPEVQADDAWGKMNDMFGQTSVPDTQLQKVGKFKYFVKYGLGLLSGATIIAGSWLLIPENSKVKTEVKSHFEEKLGDSIILNDAVEEVQPIIAESLVVGQDSLIKNASVFENSRIIDSLAINKLNAQPLANAKKQFNNSGLSSDSEITLSNKKANIKIRQTKENISLSTIPESKPFENTLKKNINRENLSARFPEINRRAERITNQNTSKSGHSYFEKSFNSEKPKSFQFKDRNDSDRQINETKSDGRITFSINNLAPKSTRFTTLKNNRIIRIPVKSEIKKEENKQVKSQKSLLETLHIGLEWNAASSFKDTKYLLPGPDSTNKPYLFLIPGIWVSKDLDDKQSVTASFFVSQQYFAGNKLIKQTIDSTIKDLFYNTQMIKAVGINLSLQYNYQIFSNFAISGGLGYSKLNRALFQESRKNYAGEIFPTSRLSLRNPDLGNFVQTNLMTFKTGLIFNPGRFQLGANLIVPITNVSATSLPIRTLNCQISFRFRIK